MSFLINTVKSNLKLLRNLVFPPHQVNDTRFETCKMLVDGIDTPRVIMYETLERLEHTGNYEWAKGYLEDRVAFGRGISESYAIRLGGFGKDFMRFYDEQVLPLFKGLIKMYEEKADIDDIGEATLAVDSKLYEWMFDKFHECVVLG